MSSQPSDHQVINHYYVFIRSLGRGSFGHVIEAEDRVTGEHVAIKLLQRERETKYTLGEVLNHRRLSSKSSLNGILPSSHPHVIGFKGVFTTCAHVCIVMEYADGGNLGSMIKNMGGRLSEQYSKWFFQQMVLAVDFCHNKGIFNRDIKLQNILLQIQEGTGMLPLIKICDFGYSKSRDMSMPKSKVGTLAYMAPEVFSSTYDGKAVDVWSLGVSLFTMLFGVNPFDTPHPNPAIEAAQMLAIAGQQENERQISMKILRILGAQWSFPSEILTSPECKDLLAKILVADPTQRLTIRGIVEHSWFQMGLPPNAMSMNDAYLASNNYSGMQSEQEIRDMLSTAPKPVEVSYISDAILDAEIDKELLQHIDSLPVNMSS